MYGTKSLTSASSVFLLGLLFCPEDGGDMFFRNVGFCQNCTVLQPRRCCSSQSVSLSSSQSVA
jgi:hypothetical protein